MTVIQKQPNGLTCNSLQRLSDGGQPRRAEISKFNVIKSRDQEVIRHVDTGAEAGLQDANGNDVGTADQRVWKDFLFHH